MHKNNTAPKETFGAVLGLHRGRGEIPPRLARPACYWAAAGLSVAPVAAASPAGAAASAAGEAASAAGASAAGASAAGASAGLMASAAGASVAAGASAGSSFLPQPDRTSIPATTAAISLRFMDISISLGRTRIKDDFVCANIICFFTKHQRELLGWMVFYTSASAIQAFLLQNGNESRIRKSKACMQRHAHPWNGQRKAPALQRRQPRRRSDFPIWRTDRKEPPPCEHSLLDKRPKKNRMGAPLGDRLAVGLRTLTPSTLVRIQVPQPFSPGSTKTSSLPPSSSAVQARVFSSRASSLLQPPCSIRA